MSASSPVVTGSSEHSAKSLIRAVTERLQQTRARVLRIRRMTALGLAAMLAIAVLASLAWGDYVLELPFGVRAGALAALLAALGGSLWWFRSRSLALLTLARTAVETESHIGEFGQRLRTTLDYDQRQSEPAAASPRLLAALQQETADVAARVDWEAAVDDRPALLGLGGAALALLAWGLPLALVPEYRTATARTLLWPSEYSHVDFLPREQTVSLGAAANLEITISGRPLRSGLVRHRPVGQGLDWTSIDLADLAANPPEESPESAPAGNAQTAPAIALTGTLTARFEQLEHDLEIEVLAGPRELPRGRITVLQPLKLERATAQISPPTYTGRPAESVTGLELRVLEGSQVDFQLALNRTAFEATLIPLAEPHAPNAADADRSAAIPLAIVDHNLVGSLADLRANASYGVSARTADGMSLEPLTLRIRVQADRKPDVRLVAPREELIVTPTTEVPVIAEASDDLGLHAVGIQYQVNDGELQTLWEGSGDGSTETLRTLATLLLEDLPVTFRDSFSYYAYAEDNYFGQPRRTTTELRFIDIRPYKVDYQLSTAQGGGGACNGSSASLEELVHRQRKNLVAAFAARDDQSVSAETAETLRRGEADLRQRTREFAQALAAQFGPVPTLDAAETAMGTAVDAFARHELTAAVDAERQALAHLMQARENLRQMLKNSNSSQASACQKFDRDFHQKLRKPEPPPNTPERQLAEARTQLQKLAQRERQWGEQARQACQSPGASSPSSPQSNSGQPSNPAASAASSQRPSPNQGPSPNQNPSERQSPNTADAVNPAEPSPSTAGSEQADPTPPGSPSKPESAPGEKRPSAEELARAQSELRQELAELKRQLDGLQAAGKAAPHQADHADQAMQQGLEQLEAGAGAAAERSAEDSARHIEALADHLAALASGDFGERLDEAHRQTRELAQAQHDLAGELGAAESSTQSGLKSSPRQSSDKSSQASPPGESAAAQSGTSSPSGTPASRETDPNSPRAGGTAGNPRPPNGTTPAVPGNRGTAGETQRRPAADTARTQEQLATRMELLADLLATLRREASAESPAIRRQLDNATAQSPPANIVGDMRQAASELTAGRASEAARSAAAARDDLHQLERALGTARGEFAQPQLQELLALEEQLAQLLQQAERQDDARTAELQQKWQRLSERLDRMAQADRRLAEALAQAEQPAGSNSEPAAASGGSKASSSLQTRPTKPGAARRNPREPNSTGDIPQGHLPWIAQHDLEGAREVARVLQSKIQEAILSSALLDSDQPVPAEYKPLVEKYYKTLSDDLR